MNYASQTAANHLQAESRGSNEMPEVRLANRGRVLDEGDGCFHAPKYRAAGALRDCETLAWRGQLGNNVASLVRNCSLCFHG